MTGDNLGRAFRAEPSPARFPESGSDYSLRPDVRVPVRTRRRGGRG